jgi:hypothetical protein
MQCIKKVKAEQLKNSTYKYSAIYKSIFDEGFTVRKLAGMIFFYF